MTSKETSESTLHSMANLSFDISRKFDCDVSFVWDRIPKPKVGSDGIQPKPDDARLVVGLGLDF